MKKNIFLSLILLPLILLSFLAHKTIEGVVYYEKDFYFISIVSLFITVHFFFIKKWSVNIIDIILLIFTGYVLLNNYADININFNLIKVIYLFGFYLVLKEFLAGDNRRQRLTYVILISCFFLYAFHGFLQYYDFSPSSSSINKVSGYYSNPAPFAALLIALIAFPLSKQLSFLNEQDKTDTNRYKHIIEYLLFISILVGVVTIIFTKSRAAFVALIICVLLIIVQKSDLISTIGKKLNMSLKKILMILSLGVIPLFIVLYYLRPDSAYGRLVIWKIALKEMFSEKIMFGHGLDAFQNHYMSYQAQYFKENLSNFNEKFSVANTPYPFNEFIKIIVEQGSIGFFLFSILLISLFYFGYKALNSKSIVNKGFLLAGLVGLSSIIIFSNFSYPFHDITFQIIFYVIIAIISSQIPSLKKIKLSPMFSLSSTVIIFAIFFLSFQIQYEKYNAFNIWRENSSFNRDIEKLEKVKHFFKSQGLFYIDYADALYEVGRKKEAIQILEEGKTYTSNPTLYMKLGRYYDEGLNDVNKAELSYRQASFSIPYKFYPKYRLLKMYERNNLNNKSYEIAKEIIAMPIKIDSEALQSMISYANKILYKYKKKEFH